MKVGTAVFTYNRDKHLHNVLMGLKENEFTDEIFIFQDGLKCEADREGWEKTQKVVEAIDWCKIKYYLSPINKGLANSIIDGINEVFRESDAIIVLEDDCIPQPSFVTFMKQCFEEYVDNLQVYSISGYSWPIKLNNTYSDIYFCGRPCPWGWGTWKNRWQKYGRDYNIIKEIKSGKMSSKRLALWGDDLENMLINNIKGRTDSWYVFWSLLMIKENGYAINPIKSLIQNIGFDGSGVHCNIQDKFNNIILNQNQNYKFKLSKKIGILEEVEEKFSDLYGSATLNFSKEKKEDIVVYGLGSCYKKYAKKISNKYNISFFVDKYIKDRFYAGIRIIHPKELKNESFQKIIIMIEKESMMKEIKEELTNIIKVDRNKIYNYYDIL